MHSRLSCCWINAYNISHACVRPCTGRWCDDCCCVLLCTDEIWCVRERERLGDFPVVRKKLSSDFKGVSWHAALQQPGGDASSVWPCAFHENYLSVQLHSYKSSVLHMHHFYTCIQFSKGLFEQTLTANNKHSLKCISHPYMCIHMFFSPLWSSQWCIVFHFSLPAVKCKPKVHSTSLFYPSSPDLSPCWPVVFHASVAFASPALWTQIFSLGLVCQGELSPSTALQSA